MSSTAPDLARLICDEIATAVGSIPEAERQRAIEMVTAARRIFVFGEGRSGLVLRMAAMRLVHLGLTAHVVGDATTPGNRGRRSPDCRLGLRRNRGHRADRRAGATRRCIHPRREHQCLRLTCRSGRYPTHPANPGQGGPRIQHIDPTRRLALRAEHAGTFRHALPDDRGRHRCPTDRRAARKSGVTRD